MLTSPAQNQWLYKCSNFLLNPTMSLAGSEDVKFGQIWPWSDFENRIRYVVETTNIVALCSGRLALRRVTVTISSWHLIKPSRFTELGHQSVARILTTGDVIKVTDTPGAPVSHYHQILWRKRSQKKWQVLCNSRCVSRTDCMLSYLVKGAGC